MVRSVRCLALLLVFAGSAGAATIVVDTVADTDGADGFCSLREAIFAANLDLPRNECPAGAGADRIRFELTLPATIALASSLPSVSASLALEGPGRDLLTLDGGDAWSALHFSAVGSTAFLRVADLTITRAFRSTFGGSALAATSSDWVRLERVDFVANVGEGYGGAVDITGVTSSPAIAEIRDCRFATNVSTGLGGGALRFGRGQLRIEGTTFDSNSVPDGDGGALNAIGSGIEIVRSTFSGNEAGDFGGAISFSAGSNAAEFSTFELRDSTFTANRAIVDANALGGGGGLNLSGSGGAVGEMVMRNSIVAGNQDLNVGSGKTDLIFGAAWTLVTTGWNLIGDPTGATAVFPSGTPNGDVDFVGTAAAPLDPLLETLADNGGATPTHRPLIDAGSWVIDHGFCPDSEVDQRGHGGGLAGGRIVGVPNVPDDPQSDGCDIGAVERNTPEAPASALFDDGFETGTTLPWSSEVP
jgi:CSLREA domain-containing protein